MFYVLVKLFEHDRIESFVPCILHLHVSPQPVEHVSHDIRQVCGKFILNHVHRVPTGVKHDNMVGKIESVD